MEQYQHIRKGISNHTAIDNNDEKKKKTHNKIFQLPICYELSNNCIGDQKETLL